MPPPERMERFQKATVRDLIGVDNYGEPKLGDPREINVRWKWGSNQAIGPQGQPVTVDASLSLAEDIAVGSMLWQCPLESYYGTGSGEEDEYPQMEVVTISWSKDIKGRETRRTAGLKFFRDKKVPNES